MIAPSDFRWEGAVPPSRTGLKTKRALERRMRDSLRAAEVSTKKFYAVGAVQLGGY